MIRSGRRARVGLEIPCAVIVINHHLSISLTHSVVVFHPSSALNRGLFLMNVQTQGTRLKVVLRAALASSGDGSKPSYSSQAAQI